MALKRSVRREPIDSVLAGLRRIPAFRGCSDRELLGLERHVDLVEVPAGRVLTEEGHLGRQAFVVLDGWAAVTLHGEPIAAVGPGELIGELALVDHQPRSATVVAKSPMRLLAVSVAAFDDFVAQPAVGRALARSLAERLRKADAALVGDGSDAAERDDEC